MDEIIKKLEEFEQIESEIEGLKKSNGHKSIMDVLTTIQRLGNKMQPVKSGVHEQKAFKPAGQSVAGHDLRVASKIAQAGEQDSLGFKAAGMQAHKRKLQELKDMPKANLPKSELEKQSGEYNQDKAAAQGVQEGFKSNTGFASMMSKLGALTGLSSSPEPKRPTAASTGTINPGLASGLSSAFGKSENHIFGIPMPKELAQHKGTIPHGHPHRDIAVKFISNVWKKHKPEGMRLSAMYLGSPDTFTAGSEAATGQSGTSGPVSKKEGNPIPAAVSEPVIRNRVDYSEKPVISGPTTLNTYKAETSHANGDIMRIKEVIDALKGLNKAKVDDKSSIADKKMARAQRQNKPLLDRQVNPKDPILGERYIKEGPKAPKAKV